MVDNPKMGMYQHYKGEKVKLIHIATHSETLEKMAVYELHYKGKTGEIGSIWVRPLNMFLENVHVNGKLVPRFQFLDE